MAVVKNISTEAGREFWAHVEGIASQVAQDHMLTKVRNVAACSRHRDIKVGAVIYDPRDQTTVSFGVNSLTAGMDETEDRLHCHPLKDLVWEHAERNVIYNAARYGLPTDGMGMAMSWYPCAPCARAIVAAGIVEMLAIEPDWTSAKWGPSWLAAEEILAKAGVKVHFVQKQAA